MPGPFYVYVVSDSLSSIFKVVTFIDMPVEMFCLIVLLIFLFLVIER